MKKIVCIAMAVAAIVFSACSSDEENPIDNNGSNTGMVLHATIDGQDATRATMNGDSVNMTKDDSGKWTFAFSGSDKINVSNSDISNYYTFTNVAKDDDKSTSFLSTDAKATAKAANWCAYFPGNDVDLSYQSGKFADVANYYALAGTTENATTGADDGISINMKPQVAILRVVKVENQKFGACDVNVRTADGKYVAGLTAKKGEAAFDVKTSDTKVTLLSKTMPGVYYIAVPAGVKISIYNGDSLRNKTKDVGLTAGKYYTVLTGPITGTKEATINGKTVQIGWVQMYPGGAKIATQNVERKLSWAEASAQGDAYVWGKNWRTPTVDEMNVVNTKYMSSLYEIIKENGKDVPVFTFTGTTLGYTNNKLHLHANSDKSSTEYGEAAYWSETEVNSITANCLQMLSYGGSNNGFWFSPYDKKMTYYVRPIVNE